MCYSLLRSWYGQVICSIHLVHRHWRLLRQMFFLLSMVWWVVYFCWHSIVPVWRFSFCKQFTKGLLNTSVTIYSQSCIILVTSVVASGIVLHWSLECLLVWFYQPYSGPFGVIQLLSLHRHWVWHFCTPGVISLVIILRWPVFVYCIVGTMQKW